MAVTAKVLLAVSFATALGATPSFAKADAPSNKQKIQLTLFPAVAALPEEPKLVPAVPKKATQAEEKAFTAADSLWKKEKDAHPGIVKQWMTKFPDLTKEFPAPSSVSSKILKVCETLPPSPFTATYQGTVAMAAVSGGGQTPAAQVASAVGGLTLIGPVIEIAVDVLVSALGPEVQKHLNEYSSTLLSSPASSWFYVASSPPSSLPQMAQAINCFRVTRYDSKGQLQFDYFGQFRMTPEYFQIRPLALYENQPVAKLDLTQPRYAVSVTIGGAAHWVQGNVGHSDYTFTQKISTTEIDQPSVNAWAAKGFQPYAEAVVLTYPDNPSTPDSDGFADWSTMPKLPLPPVSVDVNNDIIVEALNPKTAIGLQTQTLDPSGKSLFAGSIDLTATIDEVAATPTGLKALNSFLNKETSNVSKGITADIDAIAGIKSGGGS